MILDRINELAHSQPTKTALIYNGVSVDYANFARAIENLRRFLERQDLPEGATAIVVVAQLANAWAVIMALRALGLTTVHVRSLETARSLELANACCIVTTEMEWEHQGAVDLGAWKATRLIVVPRLSSVATASVELPAAARSGGRRFGDHILYTSGTTGNYKKLLWTSELEDLRSRARSRFHGFDAGTIVHNLDFGLWTAIGWRLPLSVWQLGGSVIIDQRPQRFEQFFRHPVSFCFLALSTARGLVANVVRPDREPDCEFWIGGALIGTDFIAEAIERLGPRVKVYYISTELISPALASLVKQTDDVFWLSAAADRTVQIVDEDGHECAAGQEGELRIATTEADSHEYIDDDELSSRVFRDGYFYPGDLAVKRDDGRIRILGRVADVLNIQGNKLPVGPIEQWIQQQLNVEEVCVFVGLDAAGLEQVVVAIQSGTALPRDRLQSVAERFNKFDRVRFSVLEQFPRTQPGSGKVRRPELRKLLFGAPADKSAGS